MQETTSTEAEPTPGAPASALRALGTALAVAAAGGIVIGGLLAIETARLNEWGVVDALILTGWLGLLYASLFAVGLLGLAVLGLVAGRPFGTRVHVAAVLGLSIFLSGILRYNPAIQLASVVPSLNLIGVIDLAVIAFASAAAMAGVIASDGSRRIRAFAIAIVALLGLQTLHLWHERPLRRDLEAEIAALGAAPALPAPASDAERFDSTKLLVLGFDGLTFENLLPLMRRGELPNFHAYLDGAAYGYLDTLESAISPVVWETINSGRSQFDHGIGHHIHFDFPGLPRVAHLPTFRLCNTPMGLRRLLVATHRFAPWQTAVSTALDARSARLWEVASDHGRRVGVYNWYNLGPVTPVRGFLRSTRKIAPATHPLDLEAGTREVPPLEDIDPRTRSEAEPGLSEREQALWARFVEHSLAHRPQLAMYYTHHPDSVNHLNWKYERVGDSLFLPGWSHPDFEPGPMTTPAHRHLDAILGDVLRRVSADTVVAIVSDHGFDFRGYEHDNAPPGVLMLRGPGIEPGLIEGADVFDVAPTLLHLIDLPAAEDMPGAVVDAAIGERAKRIASYGAAATSELGTAIGEDELDEEKEYLKKLGYIVD